MRIIKAYAKLISLNTDCLSVIEQAGRVCYKSEKKSTPEEQAHFIENLILRKHESVIEHGSATVLFVCDRGVSHEIVRHRLASFSQESTRYCNYGKQDQVTFIAPCFWRDVPIGTIDLIPPDALARMSRASAEWLLCMYNLETAYLEMIRQGAKPQEARSVLPNSLKTEVVMTANFREWRHFFKLRALGEAGVPHPQMLELALPLLDEFKKLLPAVFGDLVKR
jgi:thymidylate synthase (FAD)